MLFNTNFYKSFYLSGNMEAWYLKRMQRGLHVTENVTTDCLYIPESNLVLYKEQKGVYGGTEYSLVEREDVLEEIRNKISGVANSERTRVSYSDVRKVDLDPSKVNIAISDVRRSQELQESVKEGIECLLDSVD